MSSTLPATEIIVRAQLHKFEYLHFKTHKVTCTTYNK